MRKSKWRLYYIILFTLTIFITLLQVLNHSYLRKRSQLGISYDEYNCGCPRFGPSVLKNENVSLCSDWSTSRGQNQKVISYSVYGDRRNPKILTHYYNGIEDRIQESSLYYNGWTVRLYHNATKHDGETNKLICKLYCLYPNFDPCQIDNLFKPKSWNVKSQGNHDTAKSLDKTLQTYFYQILLPPAMQQQEPKNETDSSEMPIGNNGTSESKVSFAKLLIGKMWRFLPMGDDLVDDFLIRDVDSYILPREVEAVKQWQLNSTALIHAMRDHPSHNGFILAGMWGGSRRRAGPLMKSFLQQMLSWSPREIWDFDQILLLRVVWPQVLDSVMVHDSYHCRNPFLRSRSKTVPFPTQRNGSLFVGWGPKRSKTEIALIRQCPIKCRPKEHTDWKLC